MEFAPIVVDAILAGSADAIVASDRDGIIRVWNPGAVRIFGYGAVRIFGYTEAEAVDQSRDIITPERLHKRHWDGHHKTMATGESRYGEGALLSVPGVCKDGRQISLEFTIAPLKDEQGAMTGIVAVMRDVTTRFTEMRVLRERLTKASE